MAKQPKPETVEIPVEEYEEFKRSNAENTAVVSELVEKLNVLQNAQLQGVGIDPKIAARALLPRSLVQFAKHYSMSGQPSKIQKGAMVIEPYSAACGDIVSMRTDEIERIAKDFPELLITDPVKFCEKIHFKPEQKIDDHGRMTWQWVENPIPIETLIDSAIEVG